MQLEDEISHNLAQKAEKQFSHPHRKEMLLEVLGHYFVDKYLSHIQHKPELLVGFMAVFYKINDIVN